MKLETLRSLRTMAGLPTVTEDENSPRVNFYDVHWNDEPDGRQSIYIETYINGELANTVLFSDGTADIITSSGPDIDVNSSLGQEILSKARQHAKVGVKFKLEGDAAISEAPAGKGTVMTQIPSSPRKLQDIIDYTMSVWKQHSETELKVFVEQQLRNAYTAGYIDRHNEKKV